MMKAMIRGVLDPNAARKYIEKIIKRNLSSAEYLDLFQIVEWVTVIDTDKEVK